MKDKRQCFEITLNKELKTLLLEKSEKEGRSTQSIIREALASYLVSGETSNDRSSK
ncbi:MULTISPECIES: ribbon-helix-helix protein, CopG family [Serratia]|uniref:ribbon-helix-helix protein, CopG family n=1 Tax=Serratia TaxID=613 RepID=UPI0006591526|nr:ribbon-helix-helix protein, CopG family [Serratia marcescens]KMJ16670.1 hypothetical protein SN04_01257 [Serratia marcescens]HAT3675737.1 ribbon-helix-helix protein, CopG family [Serratia marcescens]